MAEIVAVATTARDSAEVVALATRHPRVFAAVGIHPNDAAEIAPGDWAEVERLASDPRVVAIGETGLDRYWDRTYSVCNCSRNGSPVTWRSRTSATFPS